MSNDKENEYNDFIESIYEELKNNLLLKVQYNGELLLEIKDYFIQNRNNFYGWANSDFWQILIDDAIFEIINFRKGEYIERLYLYQ